MCNVIPSFASLFVFVINICASDIIWKIMDSHKASYDKEPTILTCIKKQYMSFSVISKTQAFLNIVASGFLAWQQKYKCKFAYVKDQEKGYVHMCF